MAENLQAGVVYAPRLAAALVSRAARKTGLPWPDNLAMAEAELLEMSDAEIASEIAAFNACSGVEQIFVSQSFIEGLRADMRRSISKREVRRQDEDL